ncbi:MAG: D-aminoacylase [Pseudomonadales bacterium]|jgi:N-acyl-D-amino-acid deacylase|nr:D-aminoacylase [Pseudomonadales bacterium]MBL6815815.1 D-aminoacylase [Pseudomonadales bacterium]
MQRLSLILLLALLGACATTNTYDLLIENGTIYDGNGGKPYQADIAVIDDRIVAIGDIAGSADAVIDAEGYAVAPGFINMLSWATESLVIDGRSQSDIRQGVTLEVFGEGNSEGPINETMRRDIVESGGFGGADITWTTLGEYLEYLVDRGVSTNVASFIGATTVRKHEIGYEDRAPSADELQRMRALVREAMEEGAVGLGSSLIYAPAFYASTDELVELAKVVGEYDGMYISHLRSEGNRLLEAIDELIQIAREGDVAAEIYHLKMAGRQNWDKFDDVVARVETAQAEGLEITADIYTYTAGSTGLDAAMPPWVQEGGYEAWRERLRDPQIRARVLEEMTTATDEWENLWLASGTGGTLLVGFNNPDLRRYTGMTLAEVAAARGTSDADTIIDLVIEDGSRVQVVYFMMSEENVAKGVALPWVSFASDAQSMASEGVFLERSTHPRAYGNFSRVLGKYVREDQVITLPDAIRKLSKLPATNLKIRDRGELAAGYFADIVIFDPSTVSDHATFDAPHQYSTGMEHVIVNGEPVIHYGDHTGALPGQVVRGPGWRGWQD